MNLYNLTNLIKDICKGQPNVAQVEIGDVYAINHKQDVEYPAMVVTQQTSFVDNINKATTYNFTIFYIDLLDSSESNLLDVQSIATVAINDVLEGIEGAGLLLADTYEAHTFKERFNDVCAGAFVNVGIIVGNETCGGEGYSLVYSVNGQSGDVWIETPDISNYYTKSETDELIDEKIDLSDGFRIISAKARLQGDVNDDGYISISDETELSNRIRTGEGEWPEANYDVNLDGDVSIADMTLINNLILGRGELPLVVFDENPYLAVVKAFDDGKVPLVKATVGSKVYPMIVYKASSGLVNNDYTTYLSSAIYNDKLTMKVEYKEDSTYGVLSSNDIDLSNYYTKSETDELIDEKIESAITSGIDLDNYYTKDETDARISEQGDSHIDKLEVGQIDMTTHSSAGTCNINGVNKITASSGDIASLTSNIVDASSVNVQYMGSSKNVASWISQKLDASAYTPTDLSEYWTSAQTQSAITQEFAELEEQLEGKADSTALTSVYQSLTSHTSDSSIHLTSGAVQTQINNSISGKADISSLAAVAFSGDYDDLSDKPSIPLITFDSQTGILTITNQ